MMSRTAVMMMMRRRSSQSSPGSSQAETGGAEGHGHYFCKSVHIISHIPVSEEPFSFFRKTAVPEFMVEV